jgi:hypothetical protein
MQNMRMSLPGYSLIGKRLSGQVLLWNIAAGYGPAIGSLPLRLPLAVEACG